MPVKNRLPKGRLRDFTPEQRARYAALNEPTLKMHTELGLRLWHYWLEPGFKTLEEAVEHVERRDDFREPR
jgi:hypothetical protein